jgi:peroxiredoxin
VTESEDFNHQYGCGLKAGHSCTSTGETEMLNVGDQAPNFTLQSDGGSEISLAGLQGKPVIVYWYPKDDTPG